jgi:predicted transcriptional regulator
MCESTTKDLVAEAISTEPRTVAELVELTGKSESTVRKALKELENDGEATQDDESKAWSKPERRVRQNHGYARDSKAKQDATARNQEVTDFLRENGSSTLEDIADGTSCPTKRAAYHAVWRLRNMGLVEVTERKLWKLVDEDQVEAEAG